MIGEKFPDFEPRSDFEIFVLGTTKYLGNRAELGTWLDGKLALQLRHGSDLETIMERARNALATPSSTITGVCVSSRRLWLSCDLTIVCPPLKFKPKEGESNPQILVRPIPRSRYSIRLFPGSPHVQEYCLDFVDTQTGRPVNSPFKFELWSIPNPSTPWSGLGSYRVYSLEQSFRVPQPDIIPGDEKFVLRDGQTCLLKRPGHKDVRFTVPVRHQPIPPLPPAADVLDLPSEIPA